MWFAMISIVSYNGTSVNNDTTSKDTRISLGWNTKDFNLSKKFEVLVSMERDGV